MGYWPGNVKSLHGPSLYDQKGNAIDLIFSGRISDGLRLACKEFQVPPQPPSIKSDCPVIQGFWADSYQGGYVLFFLGIFL